MRVISGSARGTKLSSIESKHTRPTLDRVKEPLFSILQTKLPEAMVLDLFGGSGALAIESLSRGAKYAYICDCSWQAIQKIQENLEKTHLMEKANVEKMDYKKYLGKLQAQGCKFDIIFIDPPYAKNLAIQATKEILEKDLLETDGMIIIETDDEDRDIEELKTLEIHPYDIRKYGRVCLIFLSSKKGNTKEPLT